MSDILSYRLNHLMPMSPEVYLRLFERINDIYWPLPVFALLFGFAIVWLALRQHVRLCYALLAIVWLWQGYSFHLTFFAEINWAAHYFAMVFFIQAALFFVAVFTHKNRVSIQTRPLYATKAKLILISLSAIPLILYPALTGLMHQTFIGAHCFAFSPQPTLLLTFMMLTFITSSPRWLWVFVVICIMLYTLIDFAMGWYLGLINGLYVLAWGVYRFAGGKA